MRHLLSCSRESVTGEIKELTELIELEDEEAASKLEELSEFVELEEDELETVNELEVDEAIIWFLCFI